MNNVQALLFDVGGTIFDWKNTVRDRLQELAAAPAAGLKTALVSVPEEDSVDEGFGQRATATFDVAARDFQALCLQLGVTKGY
jgi:FMN phosphatase YigB (HAD superfamily)